MRIALVLVGRTVPGFNQLADSLIRMFSARITTAMLDFPLTRSFRKQRSQYDGELFLKELPASADVDRTIFITREDLFAGDLNFIFGLAQGRRCIVATARLDPRFYGETDMEKAKKLFSERVVKEAIHELGHTLGLPHCTDSKCVMSFSNSIEDVDLKGMHFCSKCNELKSQLI